jgi:hypothetical protein
MSAIVYYVTGAFPTTAPFMILNTSVSVYGCRPTNVYDFMGTLMVL